MKERTYWIAVLVSLLYILCNCLSVVFYTKPLTDCSVETDIEVFNNIDYYTETRTGYYGVKAEVLDLNNIKLEESIVSCSQEKLMGYFAEAPEEVAETWELITKISDTVCSKVTLNDDYNYNCIKALSQYVARTYYIDLTSTEQSLSKAIRNKRVTCTGITNLLSCLLEAKGYDVIILNSAEREALGIYLKDRLIIIDINWMCTNEYNGEHYYRGNQVCWLYFDMDWKTYCVEHKIDFIERRVFSDLYEYEKLQYG